MKQIRLGAAALNTTPMAWAGNRHIIQRAIDDAKQRNVDILCLPELVLSGYGCEDMFLSPELGRAALRSLAEIEGDTDHLIVSVGLPVWYRGAVYDCAALLVDGVAVGFVAKRYLAGDGVHYEPRWFAPWPKHHVGEVQFAGRTLPIGDLILEADGVRIGHEICEDAWVAERPGIDFYRQSVDVILNPSASHFAFGKQATRRRIALEASRMFGVAYVYANLLGNEAGRMIYDGGTLIASEGHLVTEGPRFSFADHVLAHADVDLDVNRMLRSRYCTRPETKGKPSEPTTLSLSYCFANQQCSAASSSFGSVSQTTVCDNVQADDTKFSEFTYAVTLGLFDYLRKSRSNGYVVSLSGGSDSAAAAVLISIMSDLVVAELGLDATKARLGEHQTLRAATDARELCHALLCCVYQRTDNSSDETEFAARQLAEGIGAEFHVFDVAPQVAGYRSLVEGALKKELSWDNDDIALQNIQSRARSPAVWMMANLRGALLISTSNRSEAAVGYATMDGDTSGGLAPIAGIDKHFLRDWLRWIEHDGGPSRKPRPELELINASEPTAELRPPSENQRDEDDLMPYDVLDAIERWVIRDKKFPRAVLTQLAERNPDVDAKLRLQWVRRFFQLWSRNQWKRERYAPSFHLDEESLDPKSWCRFPILSAGFEEELAELDVDFNR